jgi:hypothetical protein
MKNHLLRKGFLGLTLAVLALGWHDITLPALGQDIEESPRPLLMAHYMPWYQTPEIHGFWGWHWTMNHFDPSQVNENGRPEIASQFMPLTGPYDSSDDVLLDYQIQLMKLSGIDGVIVDWYGNEDYNDYGLLNESTQRLFEHVSAAGLLFAICYEDQTIRIMVDQGHLSSEEDVAYGQGVMRYMEENWFNDPAYLRINGQPALFTFGPQYFIGPYDWEEMFSVLETTPLLITLDEHMEGAAFASFPWPPMQLSISESGIAPAALESYLDQFYRQARRKDYIVGSAFPGFHDIYEEAGVRDSYGYLDPRDGETLQYTLDAALENGASIIQLVTWNDYGEGTIIEPTEEFGYQYLEIVQDTRRSLDASDFSFAHEDLELPLQLFNLRREHADDAEVMAQLDEAAAAILAGDLEAARTILASY